MRSVEESLGERGETTSSRNCAVQERARRIERVKLPLGGKFVGLDDSTIRGARMLESRAEMGGSTRL